MATYGSTNVMGSHPKAADSDDRADIDVSY